MHQGIEITNLMQTVDRVVPKTRYQLQDSNGTTFGPICYVFDDEALAMNRQLAEDGIDYRWAAL
jgi:hypothetical protein